ncbi:LLM class F420-dependent oxidoreductase [Streptomyces sp. NPDC102384]|uniref:LLM class F420-dependent oxidoreductase n=1 Tax=Streptomyces sp. NPDC102384 TaxID=3366166 RepID=UPI003801C792
MHIGLLLSHTGPFAETAHQVADYEAVGVDTVLLPEAYTFDSVSRLGYLAARTSRMGIASGIINAYSRSPALIAMTAAGLDDLSGGRFTLGLGASGPQVVEGFHGVPYQAPLSRLREVVEICRTVWRRDPLRHEGRHFQVPLTAERGGTGAEAKALRLINHPVRPRIPIVLAALGARTVELAAELCEGWQPTLYLPEAADEVFGPALEAGRSLRDGGLPPLEVLIDTKVRISDDERELEEARRAVRDYLALYIGGMGSRGRNFYHGLVCRYGFEKEANRIQDLYLAGRKEDAAAAVPDDLVEGLSLVGSPAAVTARIEALRASGVTGIQASPVASTHEQRVLDLGLLKKLTA